MGRSSSSRRQAELDATAARLQARVVKVLND
jgi:hypothetical protein